MSDDIVPVTIGTGYMGDPLAWCWWESQYPDEGAHGPFESEEAAIADVARASSECGVPMEVRYLSIALSDLTDAGRRALVDAITGDGVIVKPKAGS